MAGTPVASSPIAGCWGQISDTSLGNMIQAVLVAVGGPLSYENIMGMAAWALCEGPPSSQGGYNPWNTTLNSKDVLPGTAGFLGNNPQQNGGNPVKNYNGWAGGVSATVSTIGGGPINGALKAGNNPGAIAQAVGAASWGTSPACIQSKISQYQGNPQSLCSDMQGSVNTNGTSQGGSGATADAGAATPISIGPSWGDVLGGLKTLLGAITSGAFWKRVGQGLGGAVLVLIGLGFILSESKEVRGLATQAAMGAAV